ncbi:hypothetical protein JTB14_036133 [Gonioctena quinquepunctata]|nr:hypothetical protein JTB14_036133 [Gonioctena quinquepunctata]
MEMDKQQHMMKPIVVPAGASCRDLAEMQAVAEPSSVNLEVPGLSGRDLAGKEVVDEPSNIDLAVDGPSDVNQSSFAMSPEEIHSLPK